MNTLWKFGLSLVLILALGACSSSKTSGDSDNNEDLPAATDAGTDPLPQGNADNPDQKDGSQAANALDAPSASPAPDASLANITDGSPAPTPPADQAAATPPALDAASPAPAAPAAGSTADTAAPAASDSASSSTASTSTAAASAPPPPASAPATSESASGGGTGQMESYTVQKGDTLMKIAFESCGNLYKWKEIYEANKDKVSDPNNIPVGVVLKVDKSGGGASGDHSGEKYLIKKGDTLGTISNDVYGTPKKWRKIWENNKDLIKDPNKIFAGFYIYYTQSAEERDDADKLKQQPQTAPAPMVNNNPENTTTPVVAPPAPVAPAPVVPAPAPAAAAGTPPVNGAVAPAQPTAPAPDNGQARLPSSEPPAAAPAPTQ